MSICTLCRLLMLTDEKRWLSNSSAYSEEILKYHVPNFKLTIILLHCSFTVNKYCKKYEGGLIFILSISMLSKWTNDNNFISFWGFICTSFKLVVFVKVAISFIAGLRKAKVKKAVPRIHVTTKHRSAKFQNLPNAVDYMSTTEMDSSRKW